MSVLIKCTAKNLIVGELWAYQRSRKPAGVEIERNDRDERVTLSVEEALALRDWLVQWMPIISMPEPAGDRSLPAGLSEQYWPPTLDELNIAAGVDGVRPHHIASYAWPPGRKERYTPEGWAIVLKRAHSGTWPYSIDVRDFGAIPELPADLARPRAQEEGE